LAGEIVGAQSRAILMAQERGFATMWPTNDQSDLTNLRIRQLAVYRYHIWARLAISVTLLQHRADGVNVAVSPDEECRLLET
jgi:hypothetical protein